MQPERTFETAQSIYLYDGYQGNPIWTEKEDCSTYYDFEFDRQCKVPIRDIAELKKELGIN